MNIDKQTGLVMGMPFILSPNHDQRPNNVSICLLVIHNISLPPGEFGGPAIQQFFTNTLDPTTHPYFATIDQLQVSAHILINRKGQCIQFVPLHLRAWHAGCSCFEGQTNCNDFSIGIELEGTDYLAYTDAQYDVLSQLTTALIVNYPQIQQDSIVGHCDIAPKRKTDPGPAFDWSRYFSSVDF